MPLSWMKDPKVLIFTPLMLLLLFAVACGSTAAEPIIVEKEVIKEVIKEIVVEREVIKEVPVEVIVEKIVIKEIEREVMVIATPVAAITVAADRPAYVDIGAGKHYSGDFPVLASRNPGFWDVHYGGSLNSTLIAGGPRFNQLLEYNPENPSEIIGDLAKTWEVNAAGDEYIFHLNDAKWADFNGVPGKPVTADDVIYSLDRITQPGALRARTGFLKRWYKQGTATAIDDKTVKVPLIFAAAAFIPNLASDYMKMYPRAGTENLGQDDMNCCPGKYYGSGPWIFRDWKKDAEYTWDRNPNYFKSPRPFFDGIHVFIVRQTSRRQAAFVAGQAFATWQPLTNLPRDWDPVEKETNGRMRSIVLPAGATQVLFLNISRPPFDDPRVRRAIFLGIDRPEVAKTAFGEFASAGTFFGVNYVEVLNEMGNVPGWRTNKQQDFDEAKKLLAEAGYPDGLQVTLSTVSTGTTAQGAEALTPQLRKDVNIDLKLSAKGLAEMYQEMRDGTHEVTMVGTGPILRDPGDIINQFFDVDVLRNPHNWTDPRITKLINAQDRESDPAKRKALIAEMVDIFREGESHIVPFLWYDWGGMLDYRIRNWHVPATIQLVHKWDHMWFDPDRKMPTEPGYQP